MSITEKSAIISANNVTIAENEQRVYAKGLFDGELNGWHNGYEDGRKEGYNEGYDVGRQNGFTDGSIIGYEQGRNAAVKEGTITITGASKSLSISGLPSEPKTLNLLGLIAIAPEDERYFVGSLNFIKDGFSYNETAIIQAALWLRVKRDDNNATGAANGSVAKSIADRNNVFTFENGIFTIDLSYHKSYTFGDNYTYKWIATF